MAGTDIDFGSVQQAPVPQQPYKSPRHVFFGPKDSQTGQMVDEPVYVRDKTNPAQDYPAMRYKLDDGKIRGALVNSVDEEVALGDGWHDSPAKFGAITAPTFEQSRQPQPVLTQPSTLHLPKK